MPYTENDSTSKIKFHQMRDTSRMSREPVKWHTGGRQQEGFRVVFLSYVHYSTAVISKVGLMISTHWERGRWPWGENKETHRATQAGNTETGRQAERESRGNTERKWENKRERGREGTKREYRMREGEGESESENENERKQIHIGPFNYCAGPRSKISFVAFINVFGFLCSVKTPVSGQRQDGWQ